MSFIHPSLPSLVIWPRPQLRSRRNKETANPPPPPSPAKRIDMAEMSRAKTFEARGGWLCMWDTYHGSALYIAFIIRYAGFSAVWKRMWRRRVVGGSDIHEVRFPCMHMLVDDVHVHRMYVWNRIFTSAEMEVVSIYQWHAVLPEAARWASSFCKDLGLAKLAWYVGVDCDDEMHCFLPEGVFFSRREVRWENHDKHRVSLLPYFIGYI